MEQTRYVNLPVIGRVQHGEKIINNNGGTKLLEYGHFIAKIQDEFMQKFLERFNELYKGKRSLDIELLDEPFSMKYERNNQSGKVCYCMINSNNANLKGPNGWQSINCDKNNCKYRQKNEKGKMACNRIGWLKFLIPSICQDRIWLMRITSQTSLDRLNDYFELQKSRGQSLKGNYTLFLKQEEQSNYMGQTFNNYVLDILKKEDFISEQQLSKATEKPKQLPTKTNSTNVDNYVEKQKSTEIKDEQKNISNTIPVSENKNLSEAKENKSNTHLENKTTTKKETKKRTRKSEPKQEEKQIEISAKTEDNNSDNCYALLRTFNETLINKGESKEYLIGEFADMNDKISNIVIRPEYANELSECDLGTLVKLDVIESAGKKFAINLEFISKSLKNIVA